MSIHSLAGALMGLALAILTPHLHASEVIESFGEGDIHIVAAQPYLLTEDFRTLETLEKALRDTLQEAEKNQLLNDSTVVVFPELIGLYLYFMNEGEDIYQAENLFAAGALMVKSRLFHPAKAFGFLGQPPVLLKGKPMDMAGLFYRKLLNQKAPDVAKIYQSVFGKLAREFSVVIVAGSVPLPAPEVSARGELRVNTHGEMKNVSAVFHPDGSLDPKLTIKAYPTSSEEVELFISKRDVKDLPVYDLPFGTLAIAICADSWYPEVYSHYESLGADFLLVPGYIAGEKAGELLWQGYNYASGIVPPADVNELDLGWLTEWQAWEKYALPGRISKSTVSVGVSAFMKGELWGERFYGAPHLVQKGHLHDLENHPDRGTIAVLRTTHIGGH